MKKARITLALIAIMGIVGGTFAAKAAKHNYTGSVYYVTTVKGANATQTITAVSTNIIEVAVCYYCTTVFDQPATLYVWFKLTL